MSSSMSPVSASEFLFAPGDIVISPFALLAIGAQCMDALVRHVRGDWPEEDAESNRAAIKNGGRILSRFRYPRSDVDDDEQQVDVWVLTEWDRSYTSVMLAEEY